MNSSGGSDLSLAKRPSRHVSIHVPSVEEVVRPTDTVRRRKRPASLNHAHPCNTLPNNLSTTSSRSESQTAAGGRRVENAEDALGLPGENTRSQLKNSKLNSSTSRLAKERRKPVTVCALDQSSSSVVDSSADNTVLSKASRKNTATIFSRSDINRTLTTEVKSGKMSKDLAKLVICLSREELQSLPLPKAKATELRSWILAADSGCSKLPLSVQNYLNYVIQTSDNESSTTIKNRNLKISNVGFSRNVPVTSSQFCNLSNVSGNEEKLKSKLPHVKGQQFQTDSCCSASRMPLVKSDKNKLKGCPSSSRPRSFLTNTTGQQEFDDDDDDIRRCVSKKRSGSVATSRSFITRSVSDENESFLDTDTQPLISRRKSADKTVLKHSSRGTTNRYKRSVALSRNKEQTSHSGKHGKRSVTKQSSSSSVSVKNSSSFVEEAQSVIKKINRTLQFRRILQNSSFLKSATARNSTSKFCRLSNTGLKPDKLQLSESSLTEDDAVTSSDMSKLLNDQNFSVRSHLQKMTQKQTTKSLGTEFHNSAPNRSRSTTRKSSNVSLQSQRSLTRRNKLTSVHAIRKSSPERNSPGSAKAQDSATFGLSQVLDNSSFSTTPHRSTSRNSNTTQKKLRCGNARQDASGITSPDTSRNKTPTASVVPPIKVVSSCKGVNRNCKSSQRPPAQSLHNTKLPGRWSDLGSWNGKVYTINRVTSSPKSPTPKSVNDKQLEKKTQLPLKSVSSGSKNKRTCNDQFYHQASDKSSVETVISREASKRSLGSDGHAHATPVSSLDKSSPCFKVHLTVDRSDSKHGLLKRHVKKPLLSDSESSVSKSGISGCSSSNDKNVLQKRTLKIPKSAASLSVKSKTEPLPSVVSEVAASHVNEENCSATVKRSCTPGANKQQTSRLSDTESAVSNSTFVAENSWHFGVPPRSWLGSWSLSAANGSRSSLDTETDKEENNNSDDTLSVGADIRCTCSLAKVASFDRAVSTDSEPGLSTTMLLTEGHEKDREEPSNRHVSQSAHSVSVLSPSVSLCHRANAPHNDHSLTPDGDNILNPDLEDIHLEPYPPGIFSLSSIDIAVGIVSDHEDYKSTADDERTSLNSSSVCILNNDLTSTENEVKTISSVNKNAEKTGAEDLKVQQQHCKITICEVSAADSVDHLNDNVNNLVCSSSNSCLSSSGTQESDSTKCPDNVRVFGRKSLSGSIQSSENSDSSSVASLSRSTSFRPTHNSSAALPGKQHGKSLPAIPGVENEKLQKTKSQRIANSRDSLLLQSHDHDSSLKSDTKMVAGASALKSNDIRGKKMDSNCRQQASKFRTDSEGFMDKVTLVYTPDSPVKRVFDANGCQMKLPVSGGHMTLTPSQSDTGCKVLLSNGVSNKDSRSLNKTAKDVTKDHRQPSARSADQESSEDEAGRSASSSESSSSIDYESLKAVVRNLVRSSSDDHEKPAAEKIGQLMSTSSNSDTKQSNNTSITSSLSLQEPIKNKNKSSNQRESNLSLSEGEVPNCHVVNVSTSSSRGSEPDTSAVGSLADDSTLHVTCRSDTAECKIGLQHHVACDLPSSSDVTCTETESTPITSTDCDSPRCTSTSSDTTGPTRYCATTWRKELELDDRECALNKGPQTTGANSCFDEIRNATSDAFLTGFHEMKRHVPRNPQCQGLCQSVDELPAKSRRLTTYRNTGLPAAGILTSHSVSAIRHDEERNSIGFISASRYQKISNTRGDAVADESTRRNPHSSSVHAVSSRGNVRCNESSNDEDTASFSCDVTPLPRRKSLTDVRPHKTKVKVNCKSSYRAKSRRQSKRGWRPAPVESARETGSSETDADGMCRSYVSQNFDAMQSVNVCQDVKRISCSQLYRMSRAGHAVSHHSPTFDCTAGDDICDISTSSADACSWANDAIKSRFVNSTNNVFDDIKGQQDGQDNQTENNALSLQHDEDAVHSVEIMPSYENTNLGNQTDAAPVSQVTDETLPEELADKDQKEVDQKEVEHGAAVSSERSESVDVVAMHQTEDNVDTIGTSELLSRQETFSGVSRVEHDDASEDIIGSREVERSDAKIKLAGNQESCRADNSNRRPKTPSIPCSSNKYIDDTASNPPMSFSLPATESLCDDFPIGSMEVERSDAKIKLAGNQDSCRADNSNRRPKTPPIPCSSNKYMYMDDTASSPSMSFSLPATESLCDDFLEVLSSRLLNVMAKQQRQAQCSEFKESGVEAVTAQQATCAKKFTTTGVAAGPTAAQPDVVNRAAMNSYLAGAPTNPQGGPFDCSEYDKTAPMSAYHAGGRTLGIEGYLQRSVAAADCSEWTRHPGGTGVLPVKQCLAELRTTDNSAATGQEVLLIYVHAFRLESNC